MRTLSKEELKELLKSYDVTCHEILLLLSYILKLKYSALFFTKSYELSAMDYETLKIFLSRRGKSEPIAKIIEQREFYGFTFKTTHETLDPRPETELLVDLFKLYYSDTTTSLQILDLGSGTGCIGISLLKLYKNAVCHFVDISTKALRIAEENAQLHNVYAHAKFIHSNWFENIIDKYDAIITNPPYVSTEYKLDRETLYDPALALFAGNEGMDAYKVILPNASKYLKPNGLLFMELGFDHSEKIVQIKTDLKLEQFAKDLSGITRACVCRNLKC